MSERTPIPLSGTRVGRTNLGGGTAFIDDEALTVVVARAGADDQTLRVRLATIDALRVEGNELSLTLGDGTRLTFVSPGAGALHEELFARCHALPEITRPLRALGSPRRRSGRRDSASDEQQRFFAPLIAARRAAAAAQTPVEMLAAFTEIVFINTIQEIITSLCISRSPVDGPERRALEAELSDLAEPLIASLGRLGEAAGVAAAAPNDLRAWRAWLEQLAAIYETADRVWLAIDAALDELPWDSAGTGAA